MTTKSPSSEPLLPMQETNLVGDHADIGMAVAMQARSAVAPTATSWPLTMLSFLNSAVRSALACSHHLNTRPDVGIAGEGSRRLIPSL